jgi:hypothetical protein
VFFRPGYFCVATIPAVTDWAAHYSLVHNQLVPQNNASLGVERNRA